MTGSSLITDEVGISSQPIKRLGTLGVRQVPDNSVSSISSMGSTTSRLTAGRSSGIVPLASNVSIQSAHLVGICGAGMKALAEFLTGCGCRVTGSDLAAGRQVVESLHKLGFRIHSGHNDSHLPRDVEILIYSPAVGESNPERRLAAKLNIPQVSYHQFLGQLMDSRIGVSIAGTHGKSTTAAMTALILEEAEESPSVVVGAELCDRNVSGWAGEGDLLVVESCEYQRHFLEGTPKFAAILGIEPDHFDYYHDFEETLTAFSEYAGNVSADGALVVRGDCQPALEASRAAHANVVTFSMDPTSDWWAADCRRTQFGSRFRIFHGESYFTEVTLGVPGEHNIMNALAAAALAHSAGASASSVRDGLSLFRGIRRRFERVGSWRGVTLIDDYAHHPTAVQATLKTARQQFAKRRIWCAFQSHQVSRTEALFDEFAASFREADEILIPPIFAARENVGKRADTVAEELAKRITASGQSARFMHSLDQLITTLEDETRPGDVLITMGAGNIDQVHHEFTRRLHRNHAAG